jgi:RsmE family RNA methyltransferase
MNIILFDRNELSPDGTIARFDDRRANHIRQVLRPSVGDELSVGVTNGRIGTGKVTQFDEKAVTLEVRLDRDPPAPLPLTVVLALPRPKVMRRVLHGLTVMGAKRVVLLNSARVEKSYWQTPFLGAEELNRLLLLGLEQAGDTMLPEILLRRKFRPFVEDELPALSERTLKLVAHPAAAGECPRGAGRPVTLAIGPEGGFVPFEIGLFEAAGFEPVRLAERILNVETAVPASVGRLF